MNAIKIDATENTPKVILDHINYNFELAGEASPEDAKKFFNPLLAWIDDFYNHVFYIKSQNPTGKVKPINFEIHIDYITSSSLKCLYDLLKKITKLKEITPDLKITWLYDEGDDDMKENGEEFASMIELPFDIKEAV